MAKASFTPFAAQLGTRLETNINGALDRIGEAVRDTAASSIIANGVPSPNHVVSKPGDPPNADTRRLDRSISNEPAANREVRVVATAPYSAHLEWGTKRMQPRPFMRPALAKNIGAATDMIAAAVARATR